MTTVHALVDEEVPDPDRRRSVFAGDLFVYGPRQSSLALCRAASGVVEQMLGPDPSRAQRRLTEAEFTVLYRAVVRGVRHVLPSYVEAVVADLGCDPGTTYVGPPTMAVTTGSGFLPHGLGTPQHPHRDTWYAASPAQVNWRVPLYDLDAGSSVALHPRYFELPVDNSSAAFDYDEWCEARRAGRTYGAAHPLTQPRAVEPVELEPDIRISCPAGGVIVSSAAHLRSTVPNESLNSYFNVHFQTVAEADLVQGVGAANLDAAPHGTSLARFVRASDGSPIPEQLVRRDLARRGRRPDPGG